MAEEGSTTTNVVSVHRCRFVDFAPSAVTALAFPPLPLPSVKGKRNVATPGHVKFGDLVVGKANGNIELCEWTGSADQYQSAQAWVVKKTLSGPYPSKVDSLVLTIRYPDEIPFDRVPSLEDLRLFSAGGGSDLAEWDIDRGCIRRILPSQGGSIWSISPNPSSTLLALGCEDGSVRIISLENDSLIHLRRLDRVKCRVLSLAWGPPTPRSASQATNDSDSSDEDETDWSDSWIVAGCSDSCLRKWDITTGRVLERMGTDKLKGEKTLIWTVGVLGDGAIVSGDSLGMVKLWDSRTGTQLQSFQAHGADVLCLTISPEGTVIYTSGVDQKVVQFSAIKVSQPETAGSSSLLSRSSSRWIQTTSRRLHSHDVRALAIWPPYTPLPPTHKRVFPSNVSPVLASGGLDMSIVLTPASIPSSTMKSKIINPLNTSTVTTFEDSYHRRVAYSSGCFGRTGLCMAKSARLVLCVRETGITIWRVLKMATPESTEGMDVDGETGEPAGSKKEGGFERVLDMDLNVHSNLVAGAISDDGKWVVVSDWYEAKLFKMEFLKNGGLKPKRIRNFTTILQSGLPGSPPSTGGSCFVFTPDCSKLIMATCTSSSILIIDLNSEDSTPRVLRKFEHHATQNTTIGRATRGKRAPSEDVEITDKDEEPRPGESEQSDSEEESEGEGQTTRPTVTRMAVSTDGQWLATSDDRSRTHIFNLDAIQHQCILPSFPHAIHALNFDPSDPSILVLGLANNTIQIYDVESRQFPSWSHQLTHSLPQRFTQLHESLIGITFDPSTSHAGPKDSNNPTKRVALFWGSTWMCKVQLDAEVGYAGFDKKRGRDGKKKYFPKDKKKKKGGEKRGEENFKMITQYRPMLLVDFLAPGELVVVERPLVDVLAKLPPAFFKPKYGAS